MKCSPCVSKRCFEHLDHFVTTLISVSQTSTLCSARLYLLPKHTWDVRVCNRVSKCVNFWVFLACDWCLSILQMMDMFFFMFLLSIWVVAYGVAKQGILIHNENRLDWIIRGVLYEPYLIIFGQFPKNIDSEWILRILYFTFFFFLILAVIICFSILLHIFILLQRLQLCSSLMRMSFFFLQTLSLTWTLAAWMLQIPWSLNVPCWTKTRARSFLNGSPSSCFVFICSLPTYCCSTS